MLDSSRAMHHVLHGYLVTSAYALEADLLVEAGLMGNQTMIGLTPTRHPGNRVNLIRRHQRRGQPHLNAASPGANQRPWAPGRACDSERGWWGVEFQGGPSCAPSISNPAS